MWGSRHLVCGIPALAFLLLTDFPPPPSAFGSPPYRPVPRGRWRQPTKPWCGGGGAGATLKMAAGGALPPLAVGGA